MTEWRPLKRFVDPSRPITYGIVQAGPDIPGGVPYIRPVDMDGHRGVREPSELRTTSPEIAASYLRSTIRQGDLVVSIGPSFGKTMVVDDPALDGANLTQGTARVSPAPGVDARFLQWTLQSKVAVAHWEASVGGATFRALNLGPLAETPVPVIPLVAQRAMAGFLDTEIGRIDALISKKRRMVDLLRDWVIERARHMTASGPLLPARRCLAGVRTGTTPRDDEADLIRPDGEVEWISPGDVGNGLQLRPAARRVDRDALVRGVVPVFPSGSCVVVGIGATAGRVGFVDRLMSGNQQMTCLVPRGDVVDGRFLAWQLLCRADELRATAPYTTLPILNNDFLRSVSLWVPRLDKQANTIRLLDEELSRAEVLTASLEAQMTLLQERRQVLITAAVTGEFEVPGAAA